MRRRWMWVMLLGSAVGQVQGAGVGPNLLTNGGAEAPAGASDFSAVVVPQGWLTTSNLTAVAYTTSSSESMNPADSAAIGGGNNYFAGGPNTGSSSATQLLNVSTLTPLLGAGPRWYRLGGFLGGFSSQNDNMTFSASIGTGTLTIGPVLAAERLSDTSVLWRSAFGTIPAGANTATFVLTATRTSGSYNDGYADNLAFQLTAEPGDATANRQVNFDDLLVVAQNYGQTGRAWETGDFTGDGLVGFDDLLLLAQHYGSTGSLGGSTQGDASFAADWAAARALVPEPTMLAALAIPLNRRRRLA